ncbi:MAG: nuclear transport factor 2 family protein [Gemmatimonadetes bacterium]|nr:nuclear transport factor 2 family protein [Gemmatimonadota bacterium]
MHGVAGLAVAALAGLAGYPQPLAGQTPDQDAVRRVIEAVAEFSQAKNLAAMDTLFAPGGGVDIIEGAGVNHGWVDYRDNHLGRELAEFQNFQYRHYAIEPTVRGNVAWTSFRYDMAVDTPNGHIETEGRGTAVLERRDGRWVIVHQHTSGRRKQAQ